MDDIVDVGHTVRTVMQTLPGRFPHISTMKSAVLWWKACSVFAPDFHVDYLRDNPWIHQPFEVYDNLRPDQLAARVAAAARE